MIAILSAAAALAAASAGDAGAGTEMPRGRCRYSETVISRAEGAVLVTCDRLEIERDAQNATFDFSQQSWGSMLKFHGPMSGERMEVDRVTLRTGRSAEASGTCEVFYASGRLSVVSCLATAGGQAYVANFVPTRF